MRHTFTFYAQIDLFGSMSGRGIRPRSNNRLGTCAHEMNVLSTATVLPRTVADINDMLTIVFVGPNKFDPKCLKEMFTVPKRKVWSFFKLLWLKRFNRLYVDIPLDYSIMGCYPDDGLLPDIEHRIFEDHDTDPSHKFTEETAGFAEHPAELLYDNALANMDTSLTSNPSPLFLEKMGVSILTSFRACIRHFSLLDLVVLTLPKRNPKLSFETHANSLLDVPEKSFRRHHSFIFVVLNILQRRLLQDDNPRDSPPNPRFVSIA